MARRKIKVWKLIVLALALAFGVKLLGETMATGELVGYVSVALIAVGAILLFKSMTKGGGIDA